MASVVTGVAQLAAQLVGLAVLAGTLAAVVALAYRWYVRETVPRSLALLFGLAGVAVYLNTTTALGQAIAGTAGVAETEVALFNIAAFVSAGIGATLGRRSGDRFAAETFTGSGDTVDGSVGRLVRTVGRVVTVELPEDIEDIVGYDPVPDATKEKLAGRTFVFPRRLTVTQLRERLTERIRTDYAAGHVDLELADDGTVTYLALGARAAGIGPTLPPETNAVAVRADPAFAASAGDIVQVWRTDPMERVLTAELRGVSGDVATIAIDAADTPKVDPTEEYRLVTLPVEDRPDREFASLLRGARETFSSVTVEAGSPLHGLPVGALAVTVLAVAPEEAETVPTPRRGYVLAPGDTLFAIAPPEALRRLELGAEPLDPALLSVDRTPRGDNRAPTAAGADAEPGAGGETPGSPASGDAPREGAPAETGPSTSRETNPAPETTQRRAEPADTSAGNDGEPTESEPPAVEGGSAEVQEGREGDGPGESGHSDGTEPDDGAERDERGGDEPEERTPQPGERAGANSFQELKAEFESGEADWTDEGGEETSQSEQPDRDGEDDGVTFQDDLSGLDIGDEAEVSEESGGGGTDTDDGADGPTAGGDLDDLGFDDGGDDSPDVEEEDDDPGLEDDGDGLAFEDEDDSLDFEDEGGELVDLDSDEEDGDLVDLDGDDGDGLAFEEETDDGEKTEDGDEDEGDSEDEEDGEDDGDDGGGGKSFQELKAEFESGDADWEDDISDSPGGDMALDPDE